VSAVQRRSSAVLTAATPFHSIRSPFLFFSRYARKFQTHESFVTFHGPELTGAFEPHWYCLQVTRWRRNPRAPPPLFADLESPSFLDGFAGGQDGAVADAVFGYFQNSDLGLNFFLELIRHLAGDVFEALDDGRRFVLVQLLEDRFNPVPGFWVSLP